MRVQLLSFPGCPNVDAARETLRAALATAKIAAPIEEVDTTSPATAEPLREWGSPTILVNGVDIGGEKQPTGSSCRLYRDEAGRLQSRPTEGHVLAALRGALSHAM